MGKRVKAPRGHGSTNTEDSPERGRFDKLTTGWGLNKKNKWRAWFALQIREDTGLPQPIPQSS